MMKHNKRTKPGEGTGTKDAFLREILARVDRWMDEGRIPFSSKLILVKESLSAKQWILPTEQALEILRNARTFALTECECRAHFQRCENPRDVCLMINDAADKYVREKKARHVSLEEAEYVLQQANEKGLVHLTIYDPDQFIYAVCSCCSCCCHDLQLMRLCKRNDLVSHSDYIARTEMDNCSQCGTCIERCVFGARVWDDDRMSYAAEACFGCGLCVTHCPSQAIWMELREDKKRSKIDEQQRLF